VSLAPADSFSEPAACGGGVEPQTGCIEAAGRILEKLTRHAGIVPSHDNPGTHQLRQRLRPGDSLAPEQACVPFGGVQQRPGVRGSRGRGHGGPGAKVEEEDAHLLDA
jgi:hypothetical protein